MAVSDAVLPGLTLCPLSKNINFPHKRNCAVAPGGDNVVLELRSSVFIPELCDIHKPQVAPSWPLSVGCAPYPHVRSSYCDDAGGEEKATLLCFYLWSQGK